MRGIRESAPAVKRGRKFSKTSLTVVFGILSVTLIRLKQLGPTGSQNLSIGFFHDFRDFLHCLFRKGQRCIRPAMF
jgi:hypothetical protein